MNFTRMKCELDMLTSTIHKRLEVPKVLYSYLSVKWLLLLSLFLICLEYALFNGSPFALIIVIVSIPAIVKRDYSAIKNVRINTGSTDA